MPKLDRRTLLLSAAASLGMPSVLAKAWAIDARLKTGTIKDVEHVVILMQENRSFDHYFGTMNGVRGFADRFPIPLPEGRTVWSQPNPGEGPERIAPFPLNTKQTFAHMRVEGTPHSWSDAQYAWDNGRMSEWTKHKQPHSMGHYEEADIPFQFGMANAFTLCEAYHCSFQGGTNTNRLFLWSGANDGAGANGGPSISNSHDTLKEAAAAPYTWTTYPERLEEAGVSWKIYEDMADNFGDNPLVGFKAFQDSLAGVHGELAAKGLATQHLDALEADVLADQLPQVSWIISPAADSEHPGPSSPAHGADYTARVIERLTANPDVWAKTVLLVMFDENDGFFDHVPPPAPPGVAADGEVLGGSTVDTAGEYHTVRNPTEATAERDDLMGRVYGLGPRTPLYVISPWSRGGWVNAEVFDHTSVIRFLETRFGIEEPNITPWRRAVCGDLTSCFDFATPNFDVAELPFTASAATRAAALPGRTTPPIPATFHAPVQMAGVRPSRALPYLLAVDDPGGAGALRLTFANHGRATAVFHAYDRRRLDAPPQRFTVEPGKSLEGEWPDGAYDVCILGPNGFFRQFSGAGEKRPSVAVEQVVTPEGKARLQVRYEAAGGPVRISTDPDYPRAAISNSEHGSQGSRSGAAMIDAASSGGWYDITIAPQSGSAWLVRLAGRIETGTHATSDPAMAGSAVMTWG